VVLPITTSYQWGIYHEPRVYLRGFDRIRRIIKVNLKRSFDNLTHYVITHPEIEAGELAHIYHNDPKEPFLPNAHKIFIFCTAWLKPVKQNHLATVDHSTTIYMMDSSLLIVLRTFILIFNFKQQLGLLHDTTRNSRD